MEADRHLGAIGQRIFVPSSLTGMLLDYFVPYPVEEAVRRLLPKSEDLAADPYVGEIGGILPILYLLVSSREKRSEIELANVRIYAQILSGTKSLRTLDELIRLGTLVSPRNQGLRSQIVYSGGPTPSTAGVLYPPPSEIRSLVESLARIMSGDLTKWNPIEVAVIVCENAVRTHPFNDGNGRWARLLALEVGRRAGSVWAGACAALLNQSRARVETERRNFSQITIWDYYLNQGQECCEELRGLLSSNGSDEEMMFIWAASRAALSSASGALELALLSMSGSSSTPELLARKYGWSIKKSKGVFETLFSSRKRYQAYGDVSKECLAVQTVRNYLDRTIF